MNLRLVTLPAIVALAGMACVAEPVGTKSFMDDVRPACVPLYGALNEPCARRLPWSVFRYPQVHVDFSEGFIKTFPYSVEEEMRRSWGYEGIITPQIVLRGAVLPGSARCVEYSARVYASGEWHRSTSENPKEVCYVDISVHQYIVGRGPGQVTVIVGWRNHVYTDAENYGTKEYYDRLADPIEHSYEGIEFIFNLVRPWNLAHADWNVYNLWDVQRKENGEIVGVSRWIEYFGYAHGLDQFEHPLAELQETMRTVHATVSSEYGGRISDEPGSPMLVTNASRESLLAQLRELGAYDVPGITPAPAPTAEPWDGYE